MMGSQDGVDLCNTVEWTSSMQYDSLGNLVLLGVLMLPQIVVVDEVFLLPQDRQQKYKRLFIEKKIKTVQK